MSVGESGDDVIKVGGGEASSDSGGGESWLAEQVRLITVEEGLAL